MNVRGTVERGKPNKLALEWDPKIFCDTSAILYLFICSEIGTSKKKIVSRFSQKNRLFLVDMKKNSLFLIFAKKNCMRGHKTLTPPLMIKWCVPKIVKLSGKAQEEEQCGR